jgi:probable F420-dependent oxidoreductase
MNLPLEPHLRVGLQTLHRRSPPAPGAPAEPWLPRLDDLRALVERVERGGYDSLWTGDHVAFTLPILDPLLQLAQAAVLSRRLLLGTCVYLLPLRHPAHVAKQVASLDHLTEGRLIFGVGVGGEFPREYELCGVPLAERGARMSESVAVLRALWTGRPATNEGRFFPFRGVTMQPPPRQAGGPPLWFGGRSEAALRRTGRLGDGYVAYVVTPERYAQALAAIAAAAEQAGRAPAAFGTGHLLFARVDATYERALEAATENLSTRYAMDFREPARRYAALGSAEQVAERIRAFHAAGVRHLIVDLVGPYEQRAEKIDEFAAMVLPLLRDLRAP